MNYNKDFGQKGENKAENFLKSQGFLIRSRNYRFGKYGEIDIIAEKDGLLVFFEVKNRSSQHYGGPLYSISESKMRNIVKTASSFLQKNQKYYDYDIRVDLISIESDEIEWVKDICRL